MEDSKNNSVQVALVGLFVTALVTAQLIAVKILVVPTPVFADPIFVPAGVLAYALTFFVSDCYAELYGKRAARRLVNVGFAMNFVWLGLLWLAINTPGSIPALGDATVNGAPPFEAVLGLSPNIVLASLGAYVLSQHWDVIAFHRIREFTGAGKLWVRNIGSTVTSQLLDTVVFISLAFAVVPALRGGDAATIGFLSSLIVGQYVIKIAIAVVDTPFVYAVVRYVRKNGYVAGSSVPQ